MIIEEYHAKTVIRESKPSLFAWSEAYLNPYQGCFHDCKYCDGKSEFYRMHDDFGTRIRAKVNAPHLLERFLSKRKGLIPVNRPSSTKTRLFLDKGNIPKPRFILFIGGGICDVYQPAEKKVKLTRKLLQLAYDYNVPVTFLTKNTLVLRDLDLLKEINKVTYTSVNFTITHVEDSIQAIFEPGASSSTDRFEAVKILRKEGIHSGIYFYPPLPFIGDTDENMNAIFKKAQENQAEFVYVWNLTLKPGRNKRCFLETIKKHFPHLYTNYNQLYGNNNKYGTLDHKKLKLLGLNYPEVKAYKFNYEYKIPYAAKRYIPPGRDHVKTNLLLSEIMLKISYLKRCIIHERNQEARKINKAAIKLETLAKDISTMNKNEFKAQMIPIEAEPYIVDYFVNQKSKLLGEIEKEAYESVLTKLL
jgi:DNA repair photolyase